MLDTPFASAIHLLASSLMTCLLDRDVSICPTDSVDQVVACIESEDDSLNLADKRDSFAAMSRSAGCFFTPSVPMSCSRKDDALNSVRATATGLDAPGSAIRHASR